MMPSIEAIICNITDNQEEVSHGNIFDYKVKKLLDEGINSTVAKEIILRIEWKERSINHV